MERDEIRALFWSAFDAFVPGSVVMDDIAAPQPWRRSSAWLVQPGVAGGDDRPAAGRITAIPKWSPRRPPR
jgi:lysophospholipase